METEEKSKAEEGQAGERVPKGGWQDDLGAHSAARLERAVARLKNGIWILGIFTAIVCAFLVVNLTIAKKTFERVEKHLVLMGELSHSLIEIQKTTAQLKKMVEELSETEEEGNTGDSSQAWDGKI